MKILIEIIYWTGLALKWIAIAAAVAVAGMLAYVLATEVWAWRKIGIVVASVVGLVLLISVWTWADMKRKGER